MDYDSDEGRITAAEQLAAHDPRAAAEALRAIACDEGVGDEVRLSAAELLPAVDPRAAAQACLAIASDEGVGDEVRLSAAELLAPSPQAAEAFRGIPGDQLRHGPPPPPSPPRPPRPRW
jgi:hypothetical protein